MPHTRLSAFASDIRLLLVMLAMLFASVLIITSAQAVPYILCVGLADSSGHDNGTQISRCDPSSVSETLVSTTFGSLETVPVGSYEGTARASSDAFDTVNLFAKADLVNYLPGSYVPLSTGGINFAANASANYTDSVTISGPPTPVVLQLSFAVTGTLDQNGAAAQLCHNFAYGAPLGTGTCVVGLPPVITVESTPFVPDGTPRQLNFQFVAVVFNTDAFETEPYNASATTDLEGTILLQELLVTTLDDQPVPGIILTSLGGFAYPLSALNQVPAAVTEPAPYALMLAGLGLLGFMARRRKHPNTHPQT